MHNTSFRSLHVPESISPFLGVPAGDLSRHILAKSAVLFLEQANVLQMTPASLLQHADGLPLSDGRS